MKTSFLNFFFVVTVLSGFVLSVQAQDDVQKSNDENDIQAAKALFQKTTVYFETAVSEPGSAAKDSINSFLKGLHNAKALNFVVSGYCDPAGPAGFNLWLSEQRAQNVKAFLVEKGIPVTKITVNAFGESKSASVAPSDYHLWRKVEIRPVKLQN
ncbi:MAG: OmpA family protein [Prolixibacteraceae bacterium]|nr:OmpA family protein [Prolixibacteraceae bacterium]